MNECDYPGCSEPRAGVRRWCNHHYYERYYAKDDARARRQEKNRDYTRRVRARVLALYGGRCVHCGLDDTRVLQLDHVNNDGKAHRLAVGKDPTKVLLEAERDHLAGDGSRFQLLCANCHVIKTQEARAAERAIR